ncbi:MAG: hypothetical protein DRQ37_02930 [Gammaproteobacteria bacterium]|nr:MAG: hypothetical protein DRQ37_02930 [Gammaproteobacteria bacterium]
MKNLAAFPLLTLLLVAPSLFAAPMVEVRQLAVDQAYDLALEGVDELLAEDPKNLEARLFRGVLLTRLDRITDAIVEFRHLLAEHPDLAEPHNNLAVLLAAQGEFEQAREALLRAIQLQPNYDTAHENLGDIYSKLANMAYERAYQLNEENRRAERKLRMLASVVDIETAGPLVTDSPTPQENATQPPEIKQVVAPPAEDKPAQVAQPQVTKQPEPKPPPKVCYRVDGFDDESQLRPVTAWLRDDGAVVREVAEGEDKIINYKVYVPPLANRTEVNKQIVRLKTAGVRDIIQISRGDLKNGIAAGIFGTREAAQRRVTHFASLGFTARSEPRYRGRKSYWLEAMSGRSADDLRAELAANFSKIKLKSAVCSSAS